MGGRPGFSYSARLGSDVSTQVVCAFARDKYVVTTDAGHTWSKWDVSKSPQVRYSFQAVIKEAHVSPDGSGRMSPYYRDTTSELTTTDDGVHWTMKVK